MWQHLQREGDVTAERGKMRVAGDEERSRVTRGQREEEVALHSRQPEHLVVRDDAREQALVSSQHDSQEGGSRGTRPRTNRITLRAPRAETPRSNSLATTGDRRTGRFPVASRTSASDRVPRSASICTLVSKKAIIDVARANGSGGIPQHGARAQPLLLFGQQRIDEFRLRGDPAGPHELRYCQKLWIAV